jgi:hypothetical protein
MRTGHGEEWRHESLDHVRPTDAGMMEPDPAHQPATGVMGDETLVRMIGGGVPPYPGVEDDEDRQAAGPNPDQSLWEETEEPLVD